jgi:predicted ATPase
MRFRWRWKKYGNEKPSRSREGVCIVLLRTDWNDLNYYTEYEVFYTDNQSVKLLGLTKILHRESAKPYLPSVFDQLTEDYCSLGQSTDYYTSMIELLGVEAARVLCTELNDVVVRSEIRSEWQQNSGFKTSLLRMSEASATLLSAGQYFGQTLPIVQSAFLFTFACSLPGFSRRLHVELAFKGNSPVPQRLTAFVGKNGTGKSGVLARLAQALSGLNPTAGRFEPGRPNFSRTICCSYAVFQPFQVPNMISNSYLYCGLRDRLGNINGESVWDRLEDSMRIIVEKGRQKPWRDFVALTDLMGSMTGESLFESERSELKDRLRTLSTGQVVVLALFTDLLAHIERESLFLCDEPESYLHPTLLSTFLRLMHAVLEDFNSFAIVATHSPIVIQEVPSSCVRVFKREGSVPFQASLEVESFGENLTELVDRVFEMNEDDKNYQMLLRRLLKQRTAEEVVALFTTDLSMNARLMLKAIKARE